MTTTTERPVTDKKRVRAETDNVRVPASFNDMMLALAKDAGHRSVAEWLVTTDFYEWVTKEYKALLRRKLTEMERGKKDPPARN